MKKIAKKSYNLALLLVKTFISIIAIILFSKYRRFKDKAKMDDCYILGNAPSMKNVLPLINHPRKFNVICVNHFAESIEFDQIKPEFYVIVDPVIWRDTNIRDKILGNLVEKTNWELKLFVPYQAKNHSNFKKSSLSSNKYITVSFFNSTPIDGFKKFRNLTYSLQLGMPLPQNVLSAGIYLGIMLRFKNLYIFGADHSWHKEIVVNDDNILCVKQKHFYDSEIELVPFYMPGHPTIFKMHEILIAWSKMFSAYFLLKDFALNKKVNIFNSTKESFIDAFERKTPL